MSKYMTLNVSVTDVSNSFAACAVVDKIWDVDEIESMAEAMVSEARDEEREDNLQKLCEEILAHLSSTED